MSGTKRDRKLTVVALTALMLLLSASIAIGTNPPPEGTHPRGTALIMDMTFTPVLRTGLSPDDPENYGVAFVGSGTCMGSPVVIEYSEALVVSNLFSAVNKEALLDYYLQFPTGLPKDPVTGIVSDCVPRDKDDEIIAEGIVIRAVTDFEENIDPDDYAKSYKWARVILLFTVPK